jgi:hypothetical protein
LRTRERGCEASSVETTPTFIWLHRRQRIRISAERFAQFRDAIERRTAAVAMAATIIIARAFATNRRALLVEQVIAAGIAGRTQKARANVAFVAQPETASKRID